MVSTTAFKGSSSGEIVEASIPRKPLDGSQVLIEIHAAGFCGTDLHYTHQDMVLGHEGAGVVVELGPKVKHLKVGDRVGFGWSHDSCGRCDNCLVGEGGHCLEKMHSFGLTELDQGGFSTHAIWEEEFLYALPDAMSFTDAAPMMCAGMTVFTPLVRYGVKATDRVGVVGIGALGHLAIQFASKMGCEVVAFSGSDSKREEALKLGATKFVVTRGDDKIDLKDLGGRLNHLFVTTSVLPSWEKYIDIMAVYGTIYPLTVSDGDATFPFLPFLLKDLSFSASTGGSKLIFKQMFEFAVRHNVKPMIEKFPFNLDGIKEAEKKMNEGKLRYKAVLTVIDD
ncbi:hypothetical protein CJF32_00010386 [Rutstroemia sp. NJR-2017a WRK4]|nr:hypothetical protein CJF32_00010386 [Rutstroemia sp. NJR-2017a WRK4]